MNKGFYKIQTKSMADYGVTSQKDLWEKVKAEGYKGLIVTAKTEFKALEGSRYHAVFSSANQDRHGDIVMQVFDVKGFSNNPVYLDSHNYDSIEHIIGKIHGINNGQGALNGDVEFCLDNPKGVLAEKMVAKGFLNTSSIGFIPKVFDNEGNILESELLEISAVSVPANADALFEKKEAISEAGSPEEVVAIVVEEKPAEEVVEEKPEEIVDAPIEVVEQEIVVEEKPEETMEMSVAEVITDLAEEKKQTLDNFITLAKELVIEEKLDNIRKLHLILRELSQSK